MKGKGRERRLAAVWFADIVGFTGLSSRDEDAALRLLERAYAHRSPGIHDLKVDPRLDDLRSDPRFESLLGRMELE